MRVLLPLPFGPEQPHDAPRLHGEREAVLERDLVAEAVAEVADDDRPLGRGGAGGAVGRLREGGAVLVGLGAGVR